MKVLGILRGIPASGKSTWIINNELMPYTLCPDDYRIQLGAVILNEYGKQHISSKYDKVAWKRLYEDLEARMNIGQFVLVDATSTKSSSFKEYKALASKYRYRMFIIDFTKGIEVNEEYINEIKRRNANRTPSYKIVPESVIDRMAEQIKQPLPPELEKLRITPSEFINFCDSYYTENIKDLNEYESVVIIGDIHGCYDVLIDGLKQAKALDDNNSIKENIFYIFCGDYIDRGIQNTEVVNFIYDIMEKPNVIILEGNHESHILRLRDRNDYYNIIPKARETIKTLTNMSAETVHKLKAVARKCRQNFVFAYRDDTYDVTHAAKACPVDIKITSVNNITKGIGLDPYRMSKTTDLEWSKNNSMYSIHGHSNVENEPIHNTERTFNLCDSVEFGGNLRILKLS